MYGSPSEVRRITGIVPADLRFDSDPELDTWLEDRLEEISAMIEEDRVRSDFEAQGWLTIVDGVANRWCAEFLRFVMAHRDSPIVRVEDFRVEVPSDRVPGRGVLRDLRRIPRKIDKRRSFEASVVKKKEETDDGV